MKKIICPQCGEIDSYCVRETVSRSLIFDAEGEPIDATADYNIYSGTVKRCLSCGKKVKVVEMDGEQE